MINRIHPFELYVLRLFSNQSWYYPNIMNLLLSQNYNSQSSDYAIYALRSKGFLDTHYDNFGQFFALSSSGRFLLSSQSTPFVDYNPRTDNPHVPTASELQSIRLTQESDNELKRKTIENLDIQKENFKLQKENFELQKGKMKFDKIISYCSLILSVVAIVISVATYAVGNYNVIERIIKNISTNEPPTPIIKPIKK